MELKTKDIMDWYTLGRVNFGHSSINGCVNDDNSRLGDDFDDIKDGISRGDLPINDDFSYQELLR